MYAISGISWRTIDSEADLLPGETAYDTIPDSVIAAQDQVHVRRHRDLTLTACDWTQAQDSPLSVEDKAAWAAYRTALRNLPAQPGFPNSVTWPTPPSSNSISS